MSSPFALVLQELEGPADSRSETREAQMRLDRPVAGLTIPLRLALNAQQAGALSIHVAHGERALSLEDPRLTIPVVLAPPPAGVPTISLHTNVVVHRGLFAAMLDAGGEMFLPVEGTSSGQVVCTRGETPAPSNQTKLDFAPPFGFLPLAVTSQASAARATSLLLRSLRKVQDGWTSTHLNRYISLFCTRLLLRTPIHPNQLSVAILGIGLASGIVAAEGSPKRLVMGAALLKIQSILDGCDGELSRLTFRGSRLGEWLDTIGDDLSNYGFFAGASIGLFRATGQKLYLLVGLVIVSCGVVASGLEYRYLAKIGSGDLLKYPLGLDDEGGEPTSFAGKFAAAIRPLFKRDTFVMLTLLAAIFQVLGPMLVIFAFGAISIVIAVLRAEARMKREKRLAEARGQTV